MTDQLEEAFWSIPENALADKLRTSASGLGNQEAERRLEQYGPNVLSQRKRMSWLRSLARQFTSPIMLLLMIAAALSIIVGEGTDGVIILGILFISGILGFWQEYRADRAMEQLLVLLRTRVKVRRAGTVSEIPFEDVVPGDIVLLEAGAVVPGDARLIQANHLFADESSLTGESYPAEKATGTIPAETPLDKRTNVLFLGTHVVSGSAEALVVRTGTHTAFGEISRKLSHRPPETGFERGIRHFGYLLVEVALVLSLAIFAINVALDRPVLDALLFTLAIAVGITPQLLPAILSITLAHGARQMARKRVIVRRLTAIEDIGGMTILCTDKTGTLTEGVMNVDAALGVDGLPSDKVMLYAYLNAALETGFSNPIDEALRRKALDISAYHKIDELPYDFTRKRLSIAVATNGERVLITKGAVDDVLSVCSSAEISDGKITSLEDVRGTIKEHFEAYSRDGYRCLGVAYRKLGPADRVDPAMESGMTFLGIIQLLDPPKAGALEDMQRLRELGIRLKFITGDNRYVAAHIGGLARLDTSSLLTGDDVHRLSDSALMLAAEQADLFAEVDPNQKERIILALKKSGATVGYMGDGINDAAALHAADVGISVNTATDVTKQAADVVLLEKDLSALIDGVQEGRRAFANTLKYVFITISANLGNMLSMATASLFSSFLPMLPKQILLLNVLADLPSMSIATDRLDPEMVERPHRWDIRTIQRFMLVFGPLSSVFDFLTFGTLLAWKVPPVQFRTAWFLESLLSQLLVLLVLRTRRVFFRSPVGKTLATADVAVCIIALLIPVLPFTALFGFGPLSVRLVAVISVILVLYVVSAEIAKHWFFRHEAG